MGPGGAGRGKSGQKSLRNKRHKREGDGNLGALGIRSDLPNAAELADTFAHATKTDATEVCGVEEFELIGGDAGAAVGDAKADLSVRVLNLNERDGTAGVTVDVGQALLNNAEDGDFEVGRGPTEVAANIEFHADAAASGKFIAEEPEGGEQADFVEERRMKEVGNGAGLTTHLSDEAGDFVESGGRRAGKLLAMTARFVEIDGGCSDQLAEAVMEFAGQAAPFFVLRFHEVSGQLAEVFVGGVKFGGALIDALFEFTLGLVKGVARGDAFVDVGADAEPADSDGVVKNGNGAAKEPAKGAVAAAEAEFHFEWSKGGEGVAPAFDDGREEDRVMEALPTPVLELFEVEAGVFEEAVVVPDDAAVPMGNPAKLGKGIGETFEVLFAAAKFCLGLLGGGEIKADANDANELMLFVKDRRVGDRGGKEAAVLGFDSEFAGPGLAGSEETHDVSGVGLSGVRYGDFGDGMAYDFGGGPAIEMSGIVVPEGDRAVQGGGDHRGLHGGEETLRELRGWGVGG